jgi:2-dehydro-3-deoxygluconokinase
MEQLQQLYDSAWQMVVNNYLEVVAAIVILVVGRLVAGSARKLTTRGNRHQWGAVTRCNGERAISPTCELGVIDRIGGGDGFASGLIYGMLDGRELDEVVRLGWAHGALSTTFPGDVTMARLPEVETFAKGGSARVQR